MGGPLLRVAVAVGALALGTACAVASAQRSVPVPAGVLAYAQARPIVMSRLDGSAARRIAVAPRSVDSIALAPDGRKLAASFLGANEHGSAWIVSARGSVVGRMRGWVFSYTSWSADGRKVLTDVSPGLSATCGRATRRQLHLLVSSSSGAPLATIDALTPAQVAAHLARDSRIDSVAWSPDGRRIAYAVREWTCDRNDMPATTIMAADVHGDRPHIVYRGSRTGNRTAYAGDPAWSPDGRSIAVADDCEVNNGCNAIVVAGSAGGATHTFPMATPVGTTVVWTRAGIVFVSGDQYVDQVGVLDPSTGAVRWLLRGSACVTGLDDPTLKVSRDGSRVLVLDDYQTCVTPLRAFVIGLNGGGTARVTDPHAPGQGADDAILP